MPRKKLLATLAAIIIAVQAIATYHNVSIVGSFFANVGLILRDAGYLPASQAAFSTGIYLVPGAAALYSGRGYTHIMTGNTDAAVDDYNRAIEIGGTDASRLGYRAYAHALAKRPDATIADCSAAIALGTTEAWIFELRGGAYAQDRQFELAIADIQRAIEISGRNSKYLTERGQYYTLGHKLINGLCKIREQ